MDHLLNKVKKDDHFEFITGNSGMFTFKCPKQTYTLKATNKKNFVELYIDGKHYQTATVDHVDIFLFG